MHKASIHSRSDNDQAVIFRIKINYYRFDFQVQGVEWMYNNYMARKGCILADDMGLGKTVQISVLITSLIRTHQLKDTVIVAPTSLLEYWETEFNKWRPIEISVPIIKINSKKESFLIDRINFSKNQSRIFILSSNAFYDFKDHLQYRIYCDLMIIDEGHKAKNVDTNLRRSIKNFYSNRQKIILTGTPV